MRKFLRSLISRIGDLIIKKISMKVEAAVIVTGIVLAFPDRGPYEYTVIAVIWLAVVGIRYAEKVKGLFPPINKE